MTQHNQRETLTDIAFQRALKDKIELYVQNHMEHLAPLQTWTVMAYFLFKQETMGKLRGSSIHAPNEISE